jgi:WD40 repeat protein
MAFAAANGDVKVEPATAAMIIKGDGTAADTLQVSDDGSCLLLLGPSVGRCVAETGNLRFQFPTVGMKYFQLAADGGAAWMAGEDGSIRRVDEVSTVERKLDGSVCGLVADRVAGTLSVVFRKTDAMTILQPDTLEPMGNRSLKVEPVAAFSGGPGQLLAVNEQNQASVIPLQPVPEVLPTTELHQKACLSIVFHEGHIWSAGADGAVIRWPQTGTQAFELLRHSQPLTAILAAPNSRGLLAVDVAGAILQAPLRGEAVSEVLPGASGRSRILFHADREGTLHFLEGREIISWDPSGSIVSFRTVHELRGACMDARGTGLLALDVTGRVITIERPSLRIISPKSSTFTALHRTATGLLAAVDASSVSLYSADGELKGSVPMNKRIGAASGCCSEADLIAVNGPEGEIRLIDLGSRQTLREFNCGRQPTLISPDRNGEHVLIGFGGNLLEEWDAVNGMRLRQLSGHETLVLAAEYLDAGFGAVSADSSGEIRRWPDTDTQVSQVAMEQEAKAALLVGHGDVALFGKDGRLRFAARGTDEVRASAGIECVSGSVAVAEATGVVAWLVQGPENQRMLTVRNNGKTPPVNLPVSFDAVEPALSADGSIAALVVGDGIDVINLNTGLTSRRRLTNVARVLSVSPEMLIYLGRDGIIRCLGSLQLAEVTVSSSAATAVAWNEKGDTLVTGAEDGLIRIWSRSDDALKQVAQFTAGAPVRQLLFHGNRVFARSKSATVFAWLVNADGLPTAETPTEIVEAEPVDLICWDASREVLAAACRSGLGLWRVPADGSPPYKVRTQLGHEQPVTAAAVDSDAAVLMSVDASGLVAVNPLPAGADLRKTLEPVVLMSGRLNALKDVGDESDADAGSKRGRGQRKSAAEDRFRDYRLRQMQATEDGVTNLADDVSTASAEMIHQARLAGLLASVARIEPSLGLAGAELDQQSGVNDRSLSLPKSEEQATLGMRLKEADALMARLEKEAAAMPANERSAPRTSLLLELMQQIVKERRQLIDEIHQGAVESFLASQVSRRLTDAERERLKRVLQQTADSRAIQTLLTDFDFPQQWPGQSGSALRVSRDGRTLITLMPSTDEDQERITGSRIDVWDVLSGVPLKRFEVVSRLTDICLPGSESCVFSVPAVSAWPLFENRAAAPLTSAGSIKFLSLPHVELAVCAGVADTEKMRPLIELYDATTIQPLQTRLPEGFNASVRTVQKSEISGRLAFCVTRSDGSNARRHELFVCSIEDLSRFEEIAPLDTIDCSRFEEADGGAGFAALAFSPDGTRLATVAQTKSGAEGFLVRIHQLNSTRSPKPLEMRIPSELQPDRGVERTAFLNGQQKLLIHTSAGLFIGDLRDSERKSARPAISAIRFSTDVSAVTLSDDSRWAVVGTRGGTLQVYDLASSTPEASAPFPPGGAAAHDGTVISLNFSRPVTGVALPLFLASVGRENRIKIWDCTALESILDDAGRDYRKKAKK